jgi:hypothetical protein
MELFLVLFITAGCLIYAGWLIRQAFTSKADPCTTCTGCALKGKIKNKKQCPAPNEARRETK